MSNEVLHPPPIHKDPVTRSPRSHLFTLLSLAILIALPAATAISYAADWVVTTAQPEVPTFDASDQFMSTPFFMPGIRKPAVSPARNVNLPDEEPMIGVTIAGRHRAYRVAGMARPASHIVNDLIA